MAEPNALERLSYALRNALGARNRARSPRAQVSDSGLGEVELTLADAPLAPALPEPALEDMPIDRDDTLRRLAREREQNTDSMRNIQAPIPRRRDETEMTDRELFAELVQTLNDNAALARSAEERARELYREQRSHRAAEQARRAARRADRISSCYDHCCFRRQWSACGVGIMICIGALITLAVLTKGTKLSAEAFSEVDNGSFGKTLLLLLLGGSIVTLASVCLFCCQEFCCCQLRS